MFYICLIFIYMKVIITEDKRNRFAINLLEKNFPDLKKVKLPGHYAVFVMDKDMVKISYFSNAKSLYIKDDIWDTLRGWFGYDEYEIGEVLLDWVNKKFGFKAKKCYRVEDI